MTHALTAMRAPLAPLAGTGVPPELVGVSAAIGLVQELVRRAAVSEGGVLLVAERGSDVESVARELHALGRGPTAPFVAVDCGAENLDRALFGEPGGGAFDLESVSSDSRIAAARRGTLFLQQIGDLPAAVQTRLARIARDGEVRIDGAPVATHMRLVASAAPGIDTDVLEHRFRTDLYRRLTTSQIHLPPLRMRPDDVPSIAMRLLDDRAGADGTPPRAFTQAALALLAALTWPGNLAELRDAVARVGSRTTADTIHVEDLLPALPLDRAPVSFVPGGSLREARLRFERDYIAAVLQHHGWRMADAAQTLGIQRPNLYRKARQLGIPLTRVSE
jgi:two-component system, NtrC family, response regulator GlrR